MTETTTARQMPSAYHPEQIEQDVYALWQSGGYFRAGRDTSKPPFSIVLPPPNVTGSLHLGHAWNNTLQDIIIRFKRMSGYDVLWLPGTDHAGIATQTRVEKTLREEEGITRHQLGREKFVERVWAWKQRYGGVITDQIRRLGASCDWSRERFTMDEGLSRTVREVFVRLYEKGLIYRGNRIINWCPRCETALSDIEVEHREVAGTLYRVRYPRTDGQGDVVVATTRPETMFGDVAVAVHPADARYQALVGKTVRLPLTDREIPVIADEYVDPEFGTGCVKITPAHDPNDFEVGMRHQLDMPQCIDSEGRMTALAGAYQGLTREEARHRVVEDLERQGYLVQREEITHAVGHCSRCDTVVEPLLSLQWFVRMQPLAEPALAAARDGRLRFVPERFTKVFEHWLENVKDWCISRQLWWGHRIPAWYCDACGEITVARTDPDRCAHCGSDRIHQEEDVLDTWFSSALWPFSTMGWPEQTPDLARYYPTNTLVTGYDILFFWVARMVFMALEFTGEVPFRDVVLHGLVRAADGRKMSKSLGNGVDPLDVIDKYGADALRFTLATGTTPGGDQRFQWERVEHARHFINKIWNASRFVLMNLPEGFEPQPLETLPLDLADQWILQRFAETVARVTEHLERYDFGEAGRALYDFAWDEFCDWYIEFAKHPLYHGDDQAKIRARTVLLTVLDGLLRLLHPFIPFVTERLWQYLPVAREVLAVQAWPKPTYPANGEAAVTRMRVVMEAVQRVRNIRAEYGVAPGKAITCTLRCDDETSLALFRETQDYIRRLIGAERIDLKLGGEAPAKAVSAVVSGATLDVPLADLVDLAAEVERLRKEEQRLVQEVERCQKKLANEQFVSKAPAHIVEAERAKLTDYEQRLAAVQERIRALEA
ncbi:MAG: valine--tRNA ligase [Thermoflavifilum sp.]|nr:valine--tRNA ligase [Thermoflavifilum sp.]MCL6514495.1 valine--tRNA ligase [Alicyclobacillus sp.]